jgi:hypothetical protein
MSGIENTESAVVPDPMLYGQEFPRRVTVYPLGQAVEIATNSLSVENAALSLWSQYPLIFDSSTISLRIAVSERDAESPYTSPTPRGQGHLVSIITSSDNFAVADLSDGFGFAWLTRDLAGRLTSLISGFLEPLVYLMVAARHFAQVHGACVSLRGRGVVLCGESGAGKTCLAYACARAGWQLVSGDAIQIVRSSSGREIIGRPYSLRFRESARRLFPELANLQTSLSPSGKIDIEAKTMDLAIDSTIETRASHVVFLNRVSGVSEPFFDTVPFEEAFAYLVQAVSYGDEALRSAQKKSLAELLTRPILRLTYANLDGAERALRSLVE